MDRNEQPDGTNPYSLQQPWWLGNAQRLHVPLTLMTACVVVALLFFGVATCLATP